MTLPSASARPVPVATWLDRHVLHVIEEGRRKAIGHGAKEGVALALGDSALIGVA
jgi:hypothetical protein